jgi:hypothetical protein
MQPSEQQYGVKVREQIREYLRHKINYLEANSRTKYIRDIVQLVISTKPNFNEMVLYNTDSVTTLLSRRAAAVSDCSRGWSRPRNTHC